MLLQIDSMDFQPESLTTFEFEIPIISTRCDCRKFIVNPFMQKKHGWLLCVFFVNIDLGWLDINLYSSEFVVVKPRHGDSP